MKKNAKFFMGVLIVVVIAILFLLRQRSSQPEAVEVVISNPNASSAAVSDANPAENPPSEMELAVPEKNETKNSPSEITPEQLNEIRSQAKLKLVMGYAALKSFHAEFNRYTTDLIAAGAIFSDEAEMKFKMGFIAPFNSPDPADSETVKERPNRMSSDDILGEETDHPEQQYRYAPGVEKINLNEYARYCKNGCTADEDSFELLVATPIGDTGRVDVWIINQKKEMTLVQDGMQTPL